MTEIKTATFFINEKVSDADREVVAKLNEILEKMGNKIDIDSPQIIKISYNADTTQEFLSRRAGRKPKSVCHTIAEVREMLAHESSAVVAHRLGISKATLYRRLKRYNEEFRGFPESEHDWYF